MSMFETNISNTVKVRAPGSTKMTLFSTSKVSTTGTNMTTSGSSSDPSEKNGKNRQKAKKNNHKQSSPGTELETRDKTTAAQKEVKGTITAPAFRVVNVAAVPSVYSVDDIQDVTMLSAIKDRTGDGATISVSSVGKTIGEVQSMSEQADHQPLLTMLEERAAKKGKTLTHKRTEPPIVSWKKHKNQIINIGLVSMLVSCIFLVSSLILVIVYVASNNHDLGTTIGGVTKLVKIQTIAFTVKKDPQVQSQFSTLHTTPNLSTKRKKGRNERYSTESEKTR